MHSEASDRADRERTRHVSLAMCARKRVINYSMSDPQGVARICDAKVQPSPAQRRLRVPCDLAKLGRPAAWPGPGSAHEVLPRAADLLHVCLRFRRGASQHDDERQRMQRR